MGSFFSFLPVFGCSKPSKRQWWVALLQHALEAVTCRWGSVFGTPSHAGFLLLKHMAKPAISEIKVEVLHEVDP